MLKDLGKPLRGMCLTSNNWTYEHTRDEFMRVTTHKIDKYWKIQKRIIFLKSLTFLFTGISLVDEVAMCLSTWKVDEKVYSITLDNVSYNNVIATSLKLGTSIQKDLLCDGLFFQICCSCCCHILNLIVQTSLKKK